MIVTQLYKSSVYFTQKKIHTDTHMNTNQKRKKKIEKIQNEKKNKRTKKKKTQKNQHTHVEKDMFAIPKHLISLFS